jgi:hypothetical protein
MVRPERDTIGGKHPVEIDECLVGGKTRGEGRGVHHKVIVDFRFNLTPRDIQQGFSGSFETLLSISVSIETEMMTAFDEGRGVRRSNNSTTFGGMAGRTI